MNSTSHVGAVGEFIVCNYFLERGYEVFRNVAASGPGDIVIWRPGEEPKVIDVKSQRNPYLRKDGTYSYSLGGPMLKDNGVYQVVYNYQTEEVVLPHELTRTRSQDERRLPSLPDTGVERT